MITKQLQKPDQTSCITFPDSKTTRMPLSSLKSLFVNLYSYIRRQFLKIPLTAKSKQ